MPICDSDSNHIDTDIAVSEYRRAEAARADIEHGTIVFDRFAPAATVTTHDRILSGTDGIMNASGWAEIWVDSIDLMPPAGMSTAGTTRSVFRAIEIGYETYACSPRRRLPRARPDAASFGGTRRLPELRICCVGRVLRSGSHHC